MILSIKIVRDYVRLHGIMTNILYIFFYFFIQSWKDDKAILITSNIAYDIF